MLRVKLSSNSIAAEGQMMPLTPSSTRPTADCAALERCMKECAGSKLAIAAGSDVNVCLAGDVLRAAVGTTFQTIEIVVGGQPIGTYQVLAGSADLRLTSMKCGAHKDAAAWIREVARQRGVTAPKSVELVVEYGCSLADVTPTLRALSGKALIIDCHTGPF